MSNPIDHFARRRSGIVCSSLLLVYLLSACTAPGTKVQVDRSSLTKMQRLGVTVTRDEEFSVVLSRDQPLPPQLSRGASSSVGNALGFPAGLLLILVDVTVSAIHRTNLSNIDAKHTERLKPALGAFDPGRLFTEGLLRHFHSEQRFPALVNVSAEEKSGALDRGLDGILEISLKHWGLRRCGSVDRTTFKVDPNEKLQVSFYLKARIVSVAKAETVWERHELYLDNECRTLEDRAPAGILVNDLSRAIDYLSGKMANEIRFP